MVPSVGPCNCARCNCFSFGFVAPPSSTATRPNSLVTADKELFIASADGLGLETAFRIGFTDALFGALVLLLSSVKGMGGHDDGTGGCKFKYS